MSKSLSRQQLFSELFGIGAMKFGEFILKSGKKSPYYVDFRLLSSYPKVLRDVGTLMSELINSASNKPDVLCGIPSTGLAIANAMSLVSEIPTIYPKKEPMIYRDLLAYLRKVQDSSTVEERRGLQKAIDKIEELGGMKTHGLARYIDGDLREGAKIGIVDDLITTADSKLEARELLLLDADRRNIHVTINGVFVLLDREQGGAETLKKEGLELHAIAGIREAAAWLHESKLLSSDLYATITEYTLSERKIQGLRGSTG